MPRVVGIDPGTVNIDLCGLDDGRVFLDRTFPTAETLRTPALLVDLLQAAAPLDLIAGPSGYGLPLAAAGDVSEADLRLAYLAAEGEAGGIGGLRALMRLLGRSGLPVVFTPGVIHLTTVPPHRKINRVDMGTADKLCATTLALHEFTVRHGVTPADASFVLLELGGAFTAAAAVQHGRIVDGIGGSSGPLGLRAAGALDGEIAFLAGSISKDTLFSGGVDAIAGTPKAAAERLARPQTPAGRVAWDAYLEGAVKAVMALSVSVPAPREVMLSGRLALVDGVREKLAARLLTMLPRAAVTVLRGFAANAKQAAQGAALMADGLAGGQYAPLVDALDIRGARGTVLDHVYVIDRDAARRRLGIDLQAR